MQRKSAKGEAPAAARTFEPLDAPPREQKTEGEGTGQQRASRSQRRAAAGGSRAPARTKSRAGARRRARRRTRRYFAPWRDLEKLLTCAGGARMMTRPSEREQMRAAQAERPDAIGPPTPPTRDRRRSGAAAQAARCPAYERRMCDHNGVSTRARATAPAAVDVEEERIQAAAGHDRARHADTRARLDKACAIPMTEAPRWATGKQQLASKTTANRTGRNRILTGIIGHINKVLGTVVDSDSHVPSSPLAAL